VTISFGDPVIHAYQRTLNEVCWCILVSEDCVVRMKREANVPVKVLDDGVPHPSSDWAIKPCNLEPGTYAVQPWPK